MIYSINIKHNIMFEVMKEHFALTSPQIFNEVNSYFKEFNTLLNIAEINYSSLKKCLTPSSDKKEICLVFDTLLIEECYYGAKIINNLLPLFDSPKDFGLKQFDIEDIEEGVNLDENKKIFLSVLNNTAKRAQIEIVALNAGALIYLSGKTDSIKQGINLALDSIKSGMALRLFNKLLKYNKEI